MSIDIYSNIEYDIYKGQVIKIDIHENAHETAETLKGSEISSYTKITRLLQLPTPKNLCEVIALLAVIADTLPIKEPHDLEKIKQFEHIYTVALITAIKNAKTDEELSIYFEKGDIESFSAVKELHSIFSDSSLSEEERSAKILKLLNCYGLPE